MAMTTVDARLAYDYALRDAALERIRRLERRGYEVRLRYAGENQMPVLRLHRVSDMAAPYLVITLSRYTDAGAMERAYDRLIAVLASLIENSWPQVQVQVQAQGQRRSCTECGMCLD